MTSPAYNPSLRQIPRSQPAEVLSNPQEVSILAWLESTGRLKPRESTDNLLDEPDNEEISDLMANEDSNDDDYDVSSDEADDED
ncbi:hypothetical protein XM38_050620 [Halomicronema hongdechloris C2206]|uniref:DUF3134 domain-containing protein n=1 Tax=Halomicronema hongdechloris C2206 TaxID=1641165 RepID=A0A1Z3HUU3_9CYAN|nr:DUF3134 family protein [Halomicronema hongdechloris]ASC74088.1 hypothetical protein XM38_050620 [Halomicronema hongdechloris C2206]